MSVIRVARTLRLLARGLNAAAAELNPPESVPAPASDDEPSESLAMARQMANDMHVRRVLETAFGTPPTGQA